MEVVRKPLDTDELEEGVKERFDALLADLRQDAKRAQNAEHPGSFNELEEQYARQWHETLSRAYLFQGWIGNDPFYRDSWICGIICIGLGVVLSIHTNPVAFMLLGVFMGGTFLTCFFAEWVKRVLDVLIIAPDGIYHKELVGTEVLLWYFPWKQVTRISETIFENCDGGIWEFPLADVKKQYREIKEFLCNSPKDWQVKIHASVNSKEVVFPIWSCKLWQRIRSKFSSGDRGSIWARLEPHVIGILHRKSTMVPPADVACYLSQTIRRFWAYYKGAEGE